MILILQWMRLKKNYNIKKKKVLKQTMSFNLDNLIRPSVKNLKPYASARHEFTGEADVFLDANENSFGSPADEVLHRYPDPYQTELRLKLAEYKGVNPENIFFGNGSDEPIDLLMRAFCRPGIDNVITQPPTYSMYGICAAINEVEDKKVLLTADFQPEVEALKAAVNENTRLVFFCSPNNPSGNLMKREVIIELLEMQQFIVVVDEAYIDFADEPSFIHEIEKYPNLAVMQTFSKAWGLAAARLGVLYADKNIINVLNKIKPPYNISLNTQNSGLKALAAKDVALEKLHQIKEQRTFLQAELAKFPQVKQIYPADANFLLVRFPNADKLYAYLTSKGIVVRNRSKEIHCDNCLRITVGTEDENRKLVKQIELFYLTPTLSKGEGESKENTTT